MNFDAARFKAFFQNNLVLKIISFLIAIILWFAVVISMTPEQEHVITGVPIKLDLDSTATGKLKLQPISGQDKTVNVVVKGKRSVVGGLTKDDVVVSGVLTFVASAGVHDVKLTYQND